MEGRKVLVIDDDRQVRVQVCAWLHEAGFVTAAAADGEEGLQLWEPQAIAAVVTDLNMPRMDGWALIRSIRARAPVSPPQIVVITGEVDPPLLQGARDLGAGWILTKPLRRDRLLQAVRAAARSDGDDSA